MISIIKENENMILSELGRWLSNNIRNWRR